MDYLSFIENKIVKDKAVLLTSLEQWRFKEEKIVFTNGCFDILHRGHIEYLAKAAALGQRLVIGLNTDTSVKRLKGENRPVNDQQARALLLSSLIFTDKVVFFDEDTPLELIRLIQPDILVKGSDYQPEKIVGYDIVKAKGGEIITIDLTAGFSTTSILNKL
ncbi:MAG: D-glycero-beta-D-manno-heptose 1-phosphate adenylyltransferase [Odoribacter sp.]